MKARINKTAPESEKGKPSPEIIDRDTYKRIKGYDREELTQFIINLCAERIRPDYDRLRTRIGEIKGIGAARLDDIMAVIEDFFEIK